MSILSKLADVMVRYKCHVFASIPGVSVANVAEMFALRLHVG
jgi:hypothetical protein